MNNSLLDILYFYKACGYNYLPQTFQDLGYFRSMSEFKRGVEECNLCSLCKYRSKKTELNLEKSSVMALFESANFGSDDGNFGSNVGRKYLEILSVFESFYPAFLVKCVTNLPKIGSENLELCKPFIYDEIEFVSPKIIIIFGERTSGAILKNSDLMSIHGSVFRQNERFFIPTFDIFSALKNETKMEFLLEDIEKARKFL